jgi:pSer/pThr/pTyr-binding forkhead associated (FHA) protein
MPVAVSSTAVRARCADATARMRAASWTTSTFGRRLRRHHQILRGRSREIALATRASRELNLVPCGDGSSDHLPPGTRVPPSLAKTVVKLPRRDGGVVVVGRERPSDVRLNIGTVSGQHASFERDADGDVYVTDRGSSNGTDVDGRMLKPGTRYKLSVGDVVTLGDPHLARFEVVDAGEGDGGGDGGGDAARVDPEDVVLSTIDVDATYDVETVEEPPAPEPERSRSRSRSRSVQPEIVERRDGSFASDARVVFAPVGWPGPAVDLEPGVPVVIGTGLRKGDANLILTGVRGVDSAHASVLRVGGGVYVEDLGSAAGTFVGGRQVRSIQKVFTQAPLGFNI